MTILSHRKLLVSHTSQHGLPSKGIYVQGRVAGGGHAGRFLPSRMLLSCSLEISDIYTDIRQNGTLAVAGGREIAPVINNLLELPFALKIATRDFHPKDHISFDTSHDPPKKAFESFVKIRNPSNEDEAEVPIWPAHCVQGTKGSEIISEVNASKLDAIVEKGMDKNMEMFSGFADVFGSKTSQAASQDLTSLLNRKAVTHVFIVGLAGDYCVKCTALDARKEGFQAFVVDEATRSVDPGRKGWGAAKMQLENEGIRIISVHGPEVEEVRKRS